MGQALAAVRLVIRGEVAAQAPGARQGLVEVRRPMSQGIRTRMTAERRKGARQRSGSTRALKDTLTSADIGRLGDAIRLGQRNLLSAANIVRETYSIGPRGVWIIGKIGTGRVKTQSDVVKDYAVGRSIIAEEMALLTRGGLVIAEQSPTDRRQLNLRLTPLGEEAHGMLREALATRIEERLGELYSADDIHFCIDLLRTLGGDETASRETPE